jgi:hypothetical protein
MAEKTGAEAGLAANEQIRIALQTMVDGGGSALVTDIYAALEAAMNPHTLSQQGRASLRTYINRDAVRAGFVLPYDRDKPGWHITAEGREFLQSVAGKGEDLEQVTDARGDEVAVESISVRAEAFERYVLDFMKVTYAECAWYHQGRHKREERGLDLIGTRLRPEPGQPRVIGVQVKLHAAENAPAEKEWLKFLAGCFARRVDLGIFVTTGRLTSGQRREAAESQVAVIEGADELARLAGRLGLRRFDEPVPDPETDPDPPVASNPNRRR